jgi:twitching motility protein PilT
MLMTGLMRDSVRDAQKTQGIPALIAAGQAQYGMQTFDQSLLGLYKEGLITYETARDTATNPDDFDLKVRGIFSTSEMTWETGTPAPDPASPAPAQAAAGAGNGARAASPFKRR